MFDWLYALYVNSRFVRTLYGLGFFIFWVGWAQTSLRMNEVTWLVFGWLPSVFWPIQAVANWELPVLPDLWARSSVLSLGGSSFNLPWGPVLIIAGIVALAYLAWSDIKALRQNKDGDEEPQPLPVAGSV